jgi:lipopolysaccharide transport system ATP-binding protein
MSDIAIRVTGLSKRYRIAPSGGRRPYKTLQEDLLALPRRLWSELGGRTATRESFWALKDVSFDVKQGEVLGVIGRNGAGKSTLLKILSRITEPTSGQAEIYGRVGSLLEVGTGFHAELTGRENVFMSGAVLGMTRAEVRRKFDEIVDFAGVEKFLDTPTKHYSSGMTMRLAFAVAAHLEPEILLIDEVLAVGDAEFQKKCLGKMGEVAQAGRTVLFVSHQMNAVQSLCDECLLLVRGSLANLGSVTQVIGQYMGGGHSDSEWVPCGTVHFKNDYFWPTRMAVIDRDRAVVTRDIAADEGFGIQIEGMTEVLDIALTVGFALYANTGELLFWALQSDTETGSWPRIQIGSNKLVCWIPPHFLNEGDYRVELIVSLHYSAWLCQPGVDAPAINFSIRGGLSVSPYWILKRPGVMAPILPFIRVE